MQEERRGGRGGGKGGGLGSMGMHSVLGPCSDCARSGEAAGAGSHVRNVVVTEGYILAHATEFSGGGDSM